MKLVSSIDISKYEDSARMQNNALCYLNEIPDYQQYPAAWSAMSEGVCMFQRTASSSVELMNWANMAVKDAQ